MGWPHSRWDPAWSPRTGQWTRPVQSPRGFRPVQHCPDVWTQQGPGPAPSVTGTDTWPPLRTPHGTITWFLTFFGSWPPVEPLSLPSRPCPSIKYRVRLILFYVVFVIAKKKPTFEELCHIADDQRFNKTVSNSSHVLQTALPPPSTASQHYNLRRRTHTLSLPEHFTYLSDCNSITWMLHKHSY